MARASHREKYVSHILEICKAITEPIYSEMQLAYAPTINAIPIPEGATNGDILKRLLYGKAVITEFIHDVNISVNNNVIGQFDRDWWNAPYKRGETE